MRMFANLAFHLFHLQMICLLVVAISIIAFHLHVIVWFVGSPNVWSLGCKVKSWEVRFHIKPYKWAIHDFLWHHKFLCVLNLWHQYLSWHAKFFCVPWGFWSYELTRMCIKQFIINCNYDYNINSCFEKGNT
jgi:hypothetical protein